jgi:hypothetical protein
MTYLLKNPAAVLEYAIDWGAEYLEGDALADSSWSVVPEEPDGLAIAGSSFDLLLSRVSADGGILGRLYRLTNHVELASGQEDSRSIMLRVEQR